MKRCPQCDFIYPDSDDVCDFDQSSLVVAPESEIAAITNTPERPALSQLATTQSNKFESRKVRRAVPMAAGIGLLFGIVVFGVYFAVHRQMTPPPVVVQPSISRPPSLSQPSPAAVEPPSPQQDAAAPNARTSPGLGKPSTAHSTSIGPVSTSAAATGEKSSTKIILLTSGGQVEANDVWRTRDGIWYRCDGVVTLLKKNRVKAIVSQ
jgi:hypothetical protein